MLVILDLPLPFDPLEVDIDRPLEEQLPQGSVLNAAKDFLKNHAKTSKADTSS